MTLKDKVSEICRDRRITMRELERQAGLKERTIQHWDKSQPNGYALYKVSSVLKVPMEELLSVYDPDMERIAYIEKLRAENEELKKIPVTNNDDGNSVSDRDMRLLTWFRSLPEEKQKAILIAQDAPKDIL